MSPQLDWDPEPDGPPAGFYNCLVKGFKIVDYEAKGEMPGEATMWVYECLITDGPCSGQVLDVCFNIKHPNPVAMRIAKDNCTEFFEKCGIKKAKGSDTEDIIDSRIRLDLTYKKGFPNFKFIEAEKSDVPY